MGRRAAVVATTVLALLVTACGGSAGGDAAEATTTTTADGDRSPAAESDPPDEAVTPEGWRKVQAPATCRCSDGSPYHFWVRAGDPERLVFYLEGGGACFSGATCRPGSGTFKASLAGDDPDLPGSPPYLADEGIFAFDDDRNPVASWSMVYVPYCTGDLHLGDEVQDYGDGVVVQHNGAVNASTALAAAATTFPDAAEVVVAGSSAGSASAPFYGGIAHDVLPDARITVIADASAAYPADEAITTAIGALWGTFDRLPDWPTSADEPTSAWSLPGLFVRAGRHVPDITLATIDNAYDDVQARFSALIGQTGDLRDKMLANEELIESQGVEVHAWMSPGTEHTILGRSALYETEVDGTLLHDWLTELIGGADVPDVRCTTCR
jgi:hypothetical protein